MVHFDGDDRSFCDLGHETPVKKIERSGIPRRRFARDASALKLVEQSQSDDSESTADVDHSNNSSPAESTDTLSEVSAPGAGGDFAQDLGRILSGWVAQATASTKASRGRSCFHCVKVPAMSVHAYLERIRKYFLCSEECFVLALVYLDRVTKTCTSVTLCDLTVHRLVLVAILLAVKMQDDTYYSNAYYAKIGGLKLLELNALEIEMLKMLGWNVFVPVHEYQFYLGLVSHQLGQHFSL
jgi:hypothetical protein